MKSEASLHRQRKVTDRLDAFRSFTPPFHVHTISVIFSCSLTPRSLQLCFPSDLLTEVLTSRRAYCIPRPSHPPLCQHRNSTWEKESTNSHHLEGQEENGAYEQWGWLEKSKREKEATQY
jgi:hypothetical protein